MPTREILEIAPSPCWFTVGLLKKVYATGGPIEAVYEKYGVKYKPVDFLVYKNGQLWVDKDLEKESLAGWVNSIKLNLISTKNYNRLKEKIRRVLEDGTGVKKIREAIKKFLEDYRLIFEINLLAEKAFRELEIVVNDKNKLAMILKLGKDWVKLDKEYWKWEESRMKGNSVDVSDEGEFRKIDIKEQKKNKEESGWWQNLGEVKREILRGKIITVLELERMREMGRWIAVKRVSDIREKLLEIAKAEGFRKKENIYWADIDEVVEEKLDEVTVEKRKIEISEEKEDEEIGKMIKRIGVGSGKATGIVVVKDTVKSEVYRDVDKILYTKVLAPELTEILSRVVGVVGKNGSMLSHLAIVAREMGIPVVVGVGEGELKEGEKIEINGESGEIRKID